MHQPPAQHAHRQQHQAERLIAREEPPLLRAPLFRGFLFEIRPDACFRHDNLPFWRERTGDFLDPAPERIEGIRRQRSGPPTPFKEGDCCFWD